LDVEQCGIGNVVGAKYNQSWSMDDGFGCYIWQTIVEVETWEPGFERWSCG